MQMSSEPQDTDVNRSDSNTFWPRYLLLMSLSVLLLPAMVLSVCLFVAGYGPGETLEFLLTQAQAERRNLLVVGLPAVVPFALLAIVLLIYRRWRGPQGSNMVAAFGVLAIVLLLIWANAIFWPLFLPGRSYPGWPHGLEMVIVPIFFAPVGMLVAVAIAMILQRRR